MISLKSATSGDTINCAANADGEPMYFNYDERTGKTLPANMPAKFVDPARFGDQY